MEPALSIIKLCGGFSAVSEMVGVSEIQVRKWTYAREKGGAGGLIPSDRQIVLLEKAQERGIALTPDHFFGRAS